MLSVKPLFSGSSGNCTLIRTEKTNLLVDAGVSAKRITEALSNEKLTPCDISGVFITHDHIDHTRGISVLSRKYRLPVYMNTATARECLQSSYFSREDFTDNLFLYENGIRCVCGGVDVSSFDVPHDAAHAVGFSFEYLGERVCVATDTGSVTEEMKNAFRGCDTAVIEANHDLDMLMNGAYPYSLKLRVRSDRGHLSNADCADFAAFLAENGTKRIILAHISRENNSVSLALDRVKSIVGCACEVVTAV